MDPVTPPAFDALGPLPSGTTVLEASAGTGKTWTIATLAVRYIAEGVTDLSRLALVTFGRAATSELRDRVRDRLATVTRDLAEPSAAASGDPLVRHLADGPPEEVARRRGRLTGALARFDTATIATTHGFCQRALAWLGIAADLDPDTVFVGDAADLLEEVVDDVYVARYGERRGPEGGLLLTPGQARTVARAAVGDPAARLASPRGDDAGTPRLDEELRQFAEIVRGEVARRKRERGLVDYDDLVLRLRDVLADPVGGAAACARLREEVDVVLVDEFQDTDPAQWEVLRRAYHGHVPLVLIGDPKQAIYAFRGGDVAAYLAAREQAGTTATLIRNWRSDAGLLSALGTLYEGVTLGDPRIVVGRVEAAGPRPRVLGAAPLRLRRMTRGALGSTPKRTPPVARAREAVVADVTRVTVEMLASARLALARPAAAGPGREEDRPVLPADVAVLTRRNVDALAVRDALVAAGVPAVVSGLSSVFASPAASAWLTLLRALGNPGRPGPTAALALTPFVGWDVHRLGTATDAEREGLTRTVAAWSRLLADRGVAALVEAVSADGLAERLLRTSTGERTLTDLRHVGQELHEAATTEGFGVSALTDWLHRRVREAAEDYAEERSRRLDSDSAAVQVVTVHAAKGLEFPVVLVPFAWDRYEGDKQAVLRLHDPDGSRLLHVGGPGSPGFDAARESHLAEERGEDLRLLYVALTRACSQVVLWWAPTGNAAAGAASRLLLGPRSTSGALPDRVAVPRDEEAAEAFDRWAGASGGSISHETVAEPPAVRAHRGPVTASPTLHLGKLARTLDVGWRRTSYSALTAAAHEGTYGPGGEGPLVSADVGSEPEAGTVDDETDTAPSTTAAPTTAPRTTISASGQTQGRRPGREVQVPPMADLPGGTGFGTLVHAILERVDTGAPDLDAELEQRCLRAGSERVAQVGPRRLAAVLATVMRTPLGPLVDDLRLADVAVTDRLAELEFELPLAGGDGRAGTSLTPGQQPRSADVAAVGDLLRRHLPAADPLAGYADRLLQAPFASTSLRGYLTGSIDAVLRVPTPEGPRFVVVDYKTNRLAPADVPLTTEHYLPDRLAAAMVEADYALQLLLYLVALHRYLRWRLPGYDPDRHLGGGLYLFVRGMCGPATVRVDGVPAGVFGWRPPAALVVDLSALLDGARP